MKTLKFYHIIVVSLFLIGLVGCSKESTETEVNGFVADATNFNRLAGATVYLKAVNDNCFSCQGNTIETTTTDANGNFGFNFTHDKSLTYNVVANYTNYYTSFNGGVLLKNGEKNTAILTLTPKAYLRVFIKNTSPYDGNDVIGYNTLGGGGFLWDDSRYICSQDCRRKSK